MTPLLPAVAIVLAGGPSVPSDPPLARAPSSWRSRGPGWAPTGGPLVAAAAEPAGAAAPPRAATLEAGPGRGRIVVHVWKRGVLSAFAHDHHFEVTRWTARVELPDGDAGAAQVEVTLAADSLRDRQASLSDADRRKVDAQAAGPDVLDAARHPDVVFRSERVALDAAAGGGGLRGTLHGTLALRGRARPLDVAFEAEREGGGWRVRGRARVKQSDHGIRPFRAAGGAVGVKDGLDVELELVLRDDAADGALRSR